MKILKNCLVSILLSCLFTPFNGIALTTDADGVYQISSANDLWDFAKFANKNPSQQIKAVLTEDIVLNANVLNENKELNNGNFKAWTPIVHTGASGSSFDGQGHSISGLYINSFQDRLGFLGSVSGWTIKNISFNDAYINASSYVGIVCGSVKNSVLNNINVNGAINVFSTAGGACGAVSDSSLISNIVCNVDVKGTPYNGYKSSSIGGLIGYLGKSCRLFSCSSYGPVKFVENTNPSLANNSAGYFGGICGLNEGTISNVVNYGPISGKDACGGIVGFQRYQGTATLASINVGNVTGSKYVGGIVGSPQNTSISNCLNTGIVRGTTTLFGPVTGGESPSVENTFYLNTSCSQNASDGSIEVTSVQLSDGSVLSKLQTVNWLLSPETNMPVPLVNVVQYFGNGAQMQTCFAPSSAFEPKDNSILLSPVALSGHNVVVQGTEGENTCEHFKLIDKEPIHVPCPFKVKSFEYNREVNPSSDVTMVLPFAVPLSAINGTVFKMESCDTSTVVFREVADSFIIPNTPYLVAVDDAATTLLQSCEDVLCSSGDLIDIVCGEVTHFGAYKSTQFTTLPDITTYYGFSGGKFKKANTSLTVGPFRTAFALSPAITFDLGVIIQGKESAAPLLDNGNDVNAKVSVFDVSGRLIRSNVDFSSCLQGLRKGIYVVNGRKCVVSDTNYAAPISRNTLKSSHVVYNLIAE